MKHTGGYEVRGRIKYREFNDKGEPVVVFSSFPLEDVTNEFLTLIEKVNFPEMVDYGVFGETDDPEQPMDHVADCESVAEANHLAKLLHDHWEIAQWLLDGEACNDPDCDAGGHENIDDAYKQLTAVVEIARESYK